jgi:hypothetical protein
MGIAWLKAGTWKLRGIRRRFKRRVSPVFEGDDAKYILLKCSETKKME